MMQFIKYLLLPFSWLYGLGVRFRNWLFDINVKKSRSFDIPVIGVGNLSAGGTGKTPMVEYILKILLASGYQPAMLSRGYKRNTSGFCLAEADMTAATIGDEPYQVKSKFPEVVVAVCEERAVGIDTIMQNHRNVNVIVLDDSYQHRAVTPGFNILLTDFNKPFYKDSLLPAGRLREPKSGRSRADVMIVTKCPNEVEVNEKGQIRLKLKSMPFQEVYFTGISYQSLIKTNAEPGADTHFPIENLKGYKVVLFTGIANTKPLENYLKAQGIETILMDFPDHHSFSDAEIQKIIARWQTFPEMNKLILTTEKDWRRMEDTEPVKYFAGLPFYFLPIEVQWDATEKISFDKKIIDYVEEHQRKR